MGISLLLASLLLLPGNLSLDVKCITTFFRTSLFRKNAIAIKFSSAHAHIIIFAVSQIHANFLFKWLSSSHSYRFIEFAAAHLEVLYLKQ